MGHIRLSNDRGGPSSHRFRCTDRIRINRRSGEQNLSGNHGGPPAVRSPEPLLPDNKDGLPPSCLRIPGKVALLSSDDRPSLRDRFACEALEKIRALPILAQNHEPVDLAIARTAKILRGRFFHFSHEMLLIFGITNDGRVAIPLRFASGRIDKVVVPAKSLLDAVVDRGWRDFLVAHNHPSGQCHPSRQDVVETKRLHDHARARGINLQDHLIFGGDQVFSMKRWEAI